MKLYPANSFVTGLLYFRDSSTIENTDTLTINAETNYYDQFLTFQFENFSVHYCYNNHKLSYYQRTDVTAVNTSNNYSLTLSYFFEQQVEFGNSRVNLLTFIFDISVGEDYRLYKVHGYFGNNITEMTIRNDMFLSPHE